jgi:hypothetical protein
MEQISLTGSDRHQSALMQVIAFCAYHPLPDVEVDKFQEFLGWILAHPTANWPFYEKVVDALFYMATNGRVDICLNNSSLTDQFVLLLNRGTIRTIKIVLRLFNLMVDSTDDPIGFDAAAVLDLMFCGHVKIAIQAARLILVCMEKSGDYFEFFMAAKLVAKIGRALDEHPFALLPHLMELLVFLLNLDFVEVMNAVVKAGIVAKLKFAESDEAAERIINVCWILFANCSDPGVLISLKSQFMDAGGDDYLLTVFEGSQFGDLSARAEALHEAIEKIDTDGFEDVGTALFESSDDEQRQETFYES